MHNPTDFEAATIRDGHHVDVCLRRARSRLVNGLPFHMRVAIENYAATAEAVAAGGASQPRDTLTITPGGSSPGGSKDGRQAAAVDQVTFLRVMDSAVGGGAMKLGRRDPITIPIIEWWRAVCMGDASVQGFLEKRGLSRTATRVKMLNDTLRDTADRVAAAIGATKNPWE